MLGCRSRKGSLLLTGLWLLVAGTVHAQDFELAWHAPDACPTERAVRGLVERSLRPAAEPMQPVRAVGVVVQLSRTRYRLELELSQGERRAYRQLTATTCQALAQTASVLIAMAIDPDLGLAQDAEPAPQNDAQPTSVDAGLTPPSRPPSPAPSPSQRADSDAQRRSRATKPATATAPAGPARDSFPTIEIRDAKGRQVRFLASGYAGIADVGLPGAQALVGLLGGIAVQRFELAVALTALLPREQQLSRNGEVQLWSLESALEGRWLWGQRVRVGPYVALAALRSHGRAENVAEAHARTLYWVLGSFGAALRWPLVRAFALSLEGGPARALSARPRFEIAGVERASEASAWSGWGKIGMIWTSR